MSYATIEVKVPADMLTWMRKLQRELQEANSSVLLRLALYELLRRQYGLEFIAGVKAETFDACVPGRTGNKI